MGVLFSPGSSARGIRLRFHHEDQYWPKQGKELTRRSSMERYWSTQHACCAQSRPVQGTRCHTATGLRRWKLLEKFRSSVSSRGCLPVRTERECNCDQRPRLNLPPERTCTRSLSTIQL